MWSKMLPWLLGACRPPTATAFSGGWSFIAQATLSTLWQACST